MRRMAVGVIATCLLLGGCSSGMRAGMLTFQEELAPNLPAVRETPLKPQLRYLLVESGGREALMVWVGNESGPVGETSVWLSADGVVVRLLQGRLVGVSEPRRAWQLTAEAPSSQALDPASTAALVQTSDAQPGAQWGIVQDIRRQLLPATTSPMPWAEGTQGLRWVEEVDASTGQRLSLYAINAQNQTIAGQRCINPQWCLRWQTWPAPQ